jgi:uncharacterized protein
MEKRILGTHELRASKSGDKMVVKGYAATYNTLSKDLGGFRERIAPGAFRRILSTNPDVVMTFNHDVNSVLGRTTAGTLRLSEDRNGLAFECDLPNTAAGRDVWESVQRGDINGCSFAFKLASGMDELSEESVESDGGIRGAVKRTVKMIVRTIKDFANLFDCSVVTDPAYSGTSVSPRSLVIDAELRSRVQAFKPARKPWPQFPKCSIPSADESMAMRRRRRELFNQI